MISGTADLGAFEFYLAYDPAVVEITSTMLGAMPTTSERTFVQLGPIINHTTGTVAFGAYSLWPNPPGPEGDGVLAVLTWRALAVGVSNLTFTKVQVGDRAANQQTVNSLDGLVSVRPEEPSSPTLTMTPTVMAQPRSSNCG